MYVDMCLSVFVRSHMGMCFLFFFYLCAGFLLSDRMILSLAYSPDNPSTRQKIVNGKHTVSKGLIRHGQRLENVERLRSWRRQFLEDDRDEDGDILEELKKKLKEDGIEGLDNILDPRRYHESASAPMYKGIKLEPKPSEDILWRVASNGKLTNEEQRWQLGVGLGLKFKQLEASAKYFKELKSEHKLRPGMDAKCLMLTTLHCGQFNTGQLYTTLCDMGFAEFARELFSDMRSVFAMLP